jgi:hypothetical protein
MERVSTITFGVSYTLVIGAKTKSMVGVSTSMKMDNATAVNLTTT